MGKITASTTIDATPERVWEVLSDFGGIAEAAPHLTASRLTSEATGGVGASRHCDLAMPGMATEETITRWVPGQGYGVDVEMKGTPMRNGHAEFEISLENDVTVLTGVMTYELPFGPIGRAADKLGRGRMTSLWGKMLAGFKQRSETGAVIGKDSDLPIAAVEVV